MNQNQTYRHEISGDYLWSPKRNANKARNPFYESMREVSFRDTRIAALGIARSYCYESPKPTEFGMAGSYWEAIGWKIDVSFRLFETASIPRATSASYAACCSRSTRRCAPMAMACQSVYLAEVGRPFAAALFRIIGGEANQVKDVAKQVDHAERLSPSREQDLERWEESVDRQDTKIPLTDREAIILARGGQRKFRANVQGVERACRNEGGTSGAPGREPHQALAKCRTCLQVGPGKRLKPRSRTISRCCCSNLPASLTTRLRTIVRCN